MRRFHTTTRFLTGAATIAALYVLVSFLVQPLCSGPIQCRLSEALTVLPYFSFSAVPGVTLGCLLYNLISGGEPMDVLFGTLATLLAALLTYWIGRRKLPKWLAPLPSVVVNGLVVGALLTEVYGVEMAYTLAALYVAVGQAVACYAGGIPLMLLAEKYRDRFFLSGDR